MNTKNHMISFAIAIIIFGFIGTLLLRIYFSIIFAIILIPFLNPDFDQILDPECHRWFFTHSLIPSTLFWWCIYPALTEEYKFYLLPILWFYPVVHLFGDLGGVKGFGTIKILPYLRFIWKNKKTMPKRTTEEIELQKAQSNLARSYKKQQYNAMKKHHVKNNNSKDDLNDEKQLTLDLKYITMNVKWSYTWIGVNCAIGIIFSVLVFLSYIH